MAAKIAGAISKNLLKESAENRFGQEDPYFETVPATNMLGRQKMKKRRKAAPEGISAHDTKILTKVKRRAYRLDLSLCNFCGIRFGWGSVIALFPGAGDLIDALLALMVVATCTKVEGGLPGNVKIQMLFNVIFDFAIGLVPFVGDLADALYKANTRNAVLLEKHLREKGRKALGNSNQPVLVEPAGSNSSDHGETESPRRERHQEREPARPQPAYSPTREHGRSKSHRSKKHRQPDLEMGLRRN